MREARHHAQQWPLQVLFVETQGEQQVQLAIALALETVRIEAARDMRVVTRVPFAVVAAVENTVQLARLRAQQPVEPGAELGRLDFLRVARTHGGNGVRENDPGFHEIHVAVVFQELRLHQPAVQCELGELAGGKPSLIVEIVNRVHDLDARKQRVQREPRAEIGGAQRGLPIVQVNHVGIEQKSHRGHRALAKRGKAHVIVGVAVQTQPVKQRRAIDEEKSRAVYLLFPDAADERAEPQVNHDVVPRARGAIQRNRGVPRQHHRHFVAQFAQRGGERSHHVRQAASLYQRGGLGGNHQDLRHYVLV